MQASASSKVPPVSNARNLGSGCVWVRNFDDGQVSRTPEAREKAKDRVEGTTLSGFLREHNCSVTTS